jgi:hypothetical protein
VHTIPGLLPQGSTTGVGLNRHGAGEHRRHDLAPQIGAERAPGCAYRLHWGNGVEGVEGVNDGGQLETNAFNCRSDEVTSGVVCAYSEVSAWEIGVPKRCTLAEHIVAVSHRAVRRRSWAAIWSARTCGDPGSQLSCGFSLIELLTLTIAAR